MAVKAIPADRIDRVIESALRDPTPDVYLAFRGTWQSGAKIGANAKAGGPVLVSGVPIEAAVDGSAKWSWLKNGEFVVEITRKGTRSLDSAQPKELPHG